MTATKAQRQRNIDANLKGIDDTKRLFDALVPHRVAFVKIASPLWEKQPSGQFAVVDCICPSTSGTRKDSKDGSCNAIGKHPFDKGWAEQATQDWTTAKSWLEFGFSLGMWPLPGCRVIGLDEDREDALAELLATVDEDLPLMDTLVDEMRGKFHVFWLAPDGYDISELTTGTFDGGDVFRDGLVRQFVAPNMLHPAGRRRWNGVTTLATASVAFLNAIQTSAASKKEVIDTAKAPSDPGWEVAEGERHAFLLTSAARLRNLGLGEAAIYAGLHELNEMRCKPPKSDDEVRKIARDYAKKDATADSDLGITLDLGPRTFVPGPDAFRPILAYTAKPVDWLWKGWMPRGEPVILEGLGGEGKSTFIVDLMARLSRGDPMPDGAPNPFGRPVDSLYITGEDHPDKVLKPRFIAAKADLERIHFWSAEFTIPDNLQALADAIKVRPDARIVFIDPIFSHVDAALNTGSDSEVRKKVMNPLRDLAHGLDITVLIARHLNKKGGDDPVLRGSGTYGGLTGAARSVIQSISDPTDDEHERKVVGVIKANYGRMPRPWVYLLEGVTIRDGALGEDIETSRIKYLWQSDKFIDQIVLDGRVKAATKGANKYEAKRAANDDDLKEVLEGKGRVPAKDALDEMIRRGVNRDATYASSIRIGVIKTKDGNSGAWYWELPTAPTQPPLFN
jgi:hypothetical protein